MASPSLAPTRPIYPRGDAPSPRSAPARRDAASEGKGPLGQLIAIRRDEWPLAITLFSWFFLVITTFWILKPLKKGLFIGFYKHAGITLFGLHLGAAQAELVAKIANMVVAFFAAAAFSALSRKLKREKLAFVWSAGFAAAFVFFALGLAHLTSTLAWSFYLFGDLYSTLMVATFFAFTNDSVDPDTAKRLYGIVGLGGVAGGALGSTVVSSAVEKLATGTWLWICLAIGAAIVGLAALAGRLVRAHGRRTTDVPSSQAVAREEAHEHEETKEKKGNAALEGGRLVLRSRYLLAIVAIVGLYEMVSTIMDFQFTSTVQRAFEGPAIGAHFAKVFAITNWVALFVQLFLTSFIMRRFGLAVALMVLPVAAALGSAAFLAMPVMWVGSALNTADNAFSYSINQSAKEVLYVPTSRDEKYKAKAFIDMFVQRLAKAVAVLLSLAISAWFASFSGVRWLSLVTLGLLAVWGFAAVSAGRRFHALEERRES